MTTKTVTTANELVDAFFAGETDVAWGIHRLFEDTIYTGRIVLARRTPDMEILLAATSAIGEALNDALLVGAIKSGSKFTRVGDFNNMLLSEQRVADLRNGRVDNVILIGKLYGKDFTELDLSGYDKRVALKKQYDADLAVINADITKVEASVTDFFNVTRDSELKKAKELELSMMDARSKAATEAWDKGEPTPDANLVKGLGGGTRLRKATTRNGSRIEIQGTTGNTTTIGMFRQAFNRVAPVVFGERTDRMKRDMEGYDGYYTGMTRDYSTYVTTKYAKMGCQSVTHEELRRFAEILGWPVDGSPAAD